LKIIRSDEIHSQDLMTLDTQLLDRIKNDELILHLFKWSPKTMSIGCFVQPELLLNMLEIQQDRWTLVRRPSGGGVMIHEGDYCFSIIAGPDHCLRKISVLESYQKINLLLIQALINCFPSLDLRFNLIASEGVKSYGLKHSYCRSNPSQYDIALDHKKILGAAQRRKKGLLHQCSLQVHSSSVELIKNLFLQQTYVTMIESCSTALDQFVDVNLDLLESAIISRLRALL
jgi:lipoate-protein ligase A